MTIMIRCPCCRKYFGAPDLESVRTYAAQGGIIQTLTERITAQPVHYHYVTPAPLWRAVAFALPFAFFAPAATMYLHFDPLWTGGITVFCFSVGLVIGSTQVDEQEIPDEPPTDDGPEETSGETGPTRFEEVTRPGKNSISIRIAHEPPSSADPIRQRTLGQADLALAKLATSSVYPMRPISWLEAQRRRYPHGEKTFYQIQKHWLDSGLAFKSTTGAVYLKPSGIKTLRQYASQ